MRSLPAYSSSSSASPAGHLQPLCRVSQGFWLLRIYRPVLLSHYCSAATFRNQRCLPSRLSSHHLRLPITSSLSSLPLILSFFFLSILPSFSKALISLSDFLSPYPASLPTLVMSYLSCSFRSPPLYPTYLTSSTTFHNFLLPVASHISS